MWVTLSVRSKNEKTGPIAVSMTEKGSCPDNCSLKDSDCYARFSYLGIVWNRLSKKKIGDNWTAFCKRLRSINPGSLFRHNQAGDLPQNKRGKINKNKMRQLISACRHLRGFTYTHYDPKDSHNLEIIREANENGFVVNLSSDNLTEADEYAKLGLPVVTLLPMDAPNRGNKTPDGRPIVVCPAQTTDITCHDCKLCAVGTRKSIIGFKAHGTAKKRLSKEITQKNA